MDLIPKLFYFKSYKFESKKKRIIFKYIVEFENARSLEFEDIIILPKILNISKIDEKDLDNFINSLHMMLGISYYKLYIPPKIKLSKAFDRQQAEFFNTVYKKGLGEFCFCNKINPNSIAKFPFCEQSNKLITKGKKKNNRILLGIAGGKDSIVAGELLKKQKEDVTGFIFETQGEMTVPRNIAKIMGVKTIIIKHKLDNKIFGKCEGAYSGHIPFSAILGFLGVFTAYLYEI